MASYPTWRSVRRGLWVSVEQTDGVPDFRLEHRAAVNSDDPRCWWLWSQRAGRWDRFERSGDARRSLRDRPVESARVAGFPGP